MPLGARDKLGFTAASGVVLGVSSSNETPPADAPASASDSVSVLLRDPRVSYVTSGVAGSTCCLLFPVRGLDTASWPACWAVSLATADAKTVSRSRRGNAGMLGAGEAATINAGTSIAWRLVSAAESWCGGEAPRSSMDWLPACCSAPGSLLLWSITRGHESEMSLQYHPISVAVSAFCHVFQHFVTCLANAGRGGCP